jgi:hypothetical protein
MTFDNHEDPPLDDALRASPERLVAATALRRFGHAFVSRDVDEAMFRRITERIDEFTAEIDGFPGRRRAIDAMKYGIYAEPPVDGLVMDHFPDCIVSGQANPMGIAISVVRDGDEAVARVTIGQAFEGAPLRAHGGVVAAVFDDTMGFVLAMEQTPAFTGRLTISYRAPTPIGEELEFRARLGERDGRKLLVRGWALRDGAVIAEAEGLFIAVDFDRLVAEHGNGG